ncbi:MAG: hypothetical protein AEth_01304 [Candidatus Argoarchaeum ethanivorans]|uniref:Uncharacterized protein n=1 Tax=Candidatus Argoarchaeum ethanivorans TaxID=2608793 RepID=A0A8B3S258_9EURY|nr:MAG: hypothetical protein AEth_01304 [Candidatus Argoarchaeum ethanivorans]
MLEDIEEKTWTWDDFFNVQGIINATMFSCLDCFAIKN